MMRCPKCKEEYRRESLTDEKSTEQYAAWLYEYIRLGGYHKIHWDMLKVGLNEAGIAQDFWNAWHKVKDEYKREHGEKTDDDMKTEDTEEMIADLIQYLNEMVVSQHCLNPKYPCHYNSVDDAYGKPTCDCNCNRCLLAKIMSSRAKDRRKKEAREY